jgi:hypothetical protein
MGLIAFQEGNGKIPASVKYVSKLTQQALALGSKISFFIKGNVQLSLGTRSRIKLNQVQFTIVMDYNQTETIWTFLLKSCIRS